MSWPLEQDELLTQLATSSQDLVLVVKDFKQLFLDPTLLLLTVSVNIMKYQQLQLMNF
ncbi:MAG: hypothetical protein ACL7BU_14490 [Candidatus Phlomobacter fragariae]